VSEVLKWVGNAVSSFTSIAAVALLAVVILLALARRLRHVPMETALIVLGRKRNIVTGGVVFVPPIITKTQKVDLAVRMISVPKDTVLTKPVVPVTLDWIAKVQVKSDDASILIAARALGDKSDKQIEDLVTDNLGGAFREVVATLTPEQVLLDKEALAKSVTACATSEMSSLGMEILSLNVAEITDAQGYYEDLGRPQIAATKRDAEIAKAEAERDSRVKAAESKQTAETAEIASELAIAKEKKDRDVQMAEFKRETEALRATSEMAFDLRQADIDKELAAKEGATEIEKQKQAALAAQERIAVTKKTMRASVIEPALAAQEAAKATADGAAYTKEVGAKADAEATRLTAVATAEETRLTKTATADGDKALGAAKAESEEMLLKGKAAGERDLANARAAEGRVNIQELALRLHYETEVKKAEAVAAAVGEMLKDVKLTYVGGSPSASGGSNPIAETISGVVPAVAQMVAQVTGMTGMSVGEVIAEVMSLGKNTEATEITEGTENPGDEA